jgi:hypothetical protein
MKKVLLALFALALVMSCDFFGGDNYFPLKVGNRWKYEGYATFQDTAATTVDTISKTKIENEIVGTAEINGKTVYTCVTKTTNYNFLPSIDTVITVDTSYFCEDKDTIWSYESLSDTTPQIMMIKPLEASKTWQQIFDDDTVTYTVKTKETVTVPAGEYKNAWKIEVKTAGSTETQYMWYADGVGLIKLYAEYAGNYRKFWFELIEAEIK